MTVGSQAVRRNVFYSVLDYISQPAIMFVAAPVLLHSLGAQQYGTWMLVNAVAATVSGLGGGFGDGATKYISMYRGCDDGKGVVRSLLAILAVNSVLGLLSAAALAVFAPWMIAHAFPVEPALTQAAIAALRISAALLLVRFVEAVFTSALRGCEQYRPMVVISVMARVFALGAALLLSLNGYGLVPILWATLAIAIASMTGQAALASTVIDMSGSWRAVDLRKGVREVFAFGAFTWVKSTLGVLIGYGDRLLVAALLGTGSLAFYTLCNQLTQPMHALVASAFNFTFPSFSAQSASGRWSETKRSYQVAAAVAGLLVLAMAATLIVAAKLVLRLWLGAAAADQYHELLRAMAVGNGLLALSVVPHYAALALGRARALAFVNLAAGVLSLAAGYVLMQRFGLIGAGFAKITAGLVFLSLFEVARRAFRQGEGSVASVDIVPSAVNTLDFAS
jgi:O-antigen/teichoic acid export membrane protein